jgi:penicillin-binding protein 1A
MGHLEKMSGKLSLMARALSRRVREAAVLLPFLWKERRRLLLRWAAAAAGALALGLGAVVMLALADLPQLSRMADYRPPLPTVLADESGREVTRFFTEDRDPVSLDRIPRTAISAVIAIEDANFYRHHGIDYLGIARAFLRNLMAVRVVQGGSTITQQLAKSLLLSSERTLTRKVKEVALARRIERGFSKQEILEVYLNQIYFGYGSYGIERAARNYFGVHVWELSLPQAALLAGLPKAPTAYSPLRNPMAALSRRNLVLARMEEEGFITGAERAEAEKAPLGISPRRATGDDPNAWFNEHVRRHLVEKYGEERVYTGGLRVTVTVNQDCQRYAQEAVRTGLRELDKRQGYRGALGQVDAAQMDAVLASMRTENNLAPSGSVEELLGPAARPAWKGSGAFLPWAGARILRAMVKSADPRGIAVDLGGLEGWIPSSEFEWTLSADPVSGEVRYAPAVLGPGSLVEVRYLERVSDGLPQFGLEQAPRVQGALVCLDASTGRILALVGGDDFRRSQFNRATQARRQPGSAFKPVVYSAAVENGFTPSSVILDSPIIFDDPLQAQRWKPGNFEDRFYGPTTLRTALTHSRNVVTVRVGQMLGLETVTDYARRFGLDQELPPDFSLVLGSLGVTPLELTAAYTAFANAGVRVEPWAVVSVTDRDGVTLETGSPREARVLDEDSAFIMQNLLQGVVKNGTGRRAQAIGRPSGGKTGTTNEQMDAWYEGFVPGMVTGVWVGFDQKVTMGEETGARAALPIWVNYMQKALAGVPVSPFPPPPPGVQMVKVDAASGLLARPGSADFIYEAFKTGTAPREYARPARSAPPAEGGGGGAERDEPDLPGILPRDE